MNTLYSIGEHDFIKNKSPQNSVCCKWVHLIQKHCGLALRAQDLFSEDRQLLRHSEEQLSRFGFVINLKGSNLIAPAHLLGSQIPLPVARGVPIEELREFPVFHERPFKTAMAIFMMAGLTLLPNLYESLIRISNSLKPHLLYTIFENV